MRQPSLRDLCLLNLKPGVETPGYYRLSLRDRNRSPSLQVLVALDVPVSSTILETVLESTVSLQTRKSALLAAETLNTYKD